MTLGSEAVFVLEYRPIMGLRSRMVWSDQLVSLGGSNELAQIRAQPKLNNTQQMRTDLCKAVEDDFEEWLMFSSSIKIE
jgi:hypothetical protein